MSILTRAITNFRANRKIEQEKQNAGQTVSKPSGLNMRIFGIPLALGFVFLLMSLAGIAPVQPAQAIDINLSVITDTINAFIDLIEPITNLVIAIVPLWFVIMILGFIMGLLAAILGMIQAGMKLGN